MILHDYDPKIDEFNMEYDPSLCWFCGEPARVPMHFESKWEDSRLYYNACLNCCVTIVDSDILGKLYAVCTDHDH